MPGPLTSRADSRRSPRPLVGGGAVALVTGATAGIGHAFAHAVAERGHDLVLVARDGARLAAVAEQLRGHGVQVETLVADLTRREDLERVAERLLVSCDEAGPGEGSDVASAPVDLLVNNAGFALRTPVVDGDLAGEERMLDVLVRAVLVLSHAAAPTMVARGRGTIINVSSVASFLMGGTYAAAKAWVTSFTAGLDVELAGTGVRACALCPGFVRTEFHQRMGSAPDRIAPGWAWLDADCLVADCLDDVARGRTFSIPSRRYRATVALLRALPLRASPAVARGAALRRRRR